MSLPEEVINAAQMAVKFDEENQDEIAAYYYEAAARLLLQNVLSSSSEIASTLREKAQQYMSRADSLKNKSK